MYSSSKGTLKEELKFLISGFTFLLSVAVRILASVFDCLSVFLVKVDILDEAVWICAVSLRDCRRCRDSRFLLKPPNDLSSLLSF